MLHRQLRPSFWGTRRMEMSTGKLRMELSWKTFDRITWRRTWQQCILKCNFWSLRSCCSTIGVWSFWKPHAGKTIELFLVKGTADSFITAVPFDQRKREACTPSELKNQSYGRKPLLLEDRIHCVLTLVNCLYALDKMGHDATKWDSWDEMRQNEILGTECDGMGKVGTQCDS